LRALVSTTWLHHNLSNPNLIILDASVPTNASGTALKNFDRTIPLARVFDLKTTFVDPTSPYPNTIPKPEHFELECRQLGINTDSEIIVFDHQGIYSSPRVWWLFTIMGHHNIAVLDGGLPDWIANGFETKKAPAQTFETGNFEAQFDESLVVDFDQVYQNTLAKKFTIVDARSTNRFNGSGNEPRAHLKSGCIDHSVNLPYQEVLRHGKYKSKSELRLLFEEHCKTKDELVFSCGSGMTACIVMLACNLGYGSHLKVYDGSWTEWAERNDLKTMV